MLMRSKSSIIWMDIQDNVSQDTMIKIAEAEVWYDLAKDGTYILNIQCHNNLLCIIAGLDKATVDRWYNQILDCLDEAENFSLPRLPEMKVRFMGSKQKRIIK